LGDSVATVLCTGYCFNGPNKGKKTSYDGLKKGPMELLMKKFALLLHVEMWVGCI
jgi:hypothetical protein